MKKTNLIKLIVVSSLAIIIAVALSNVSFGATYNYKATNILDNLTKDGSTLYVPYIFTKTTDTLTEAKVRKDFAAKGLTIKAITKSGNEASSSIVGTGTKVTVTNNSLTYNILIYGDVDGDGKATVFDALSIGYHSVRGGSYSLKGIYLKAANVDNTDDIVTVFDALNVGYFAARPEANLKLVETAPTITPPDTTAPVITLKGNATVEVKYGKTYTDQGATAKDDFDGTVTVKTSGTVNTSKVGTYTITYTATDKAGNKATKTRKVKVVDYNLDPEFTAPDKKDYIKSEPLSVHGGKFTIKSAATGNVVKTDSITTSMIKNYATATNKVGRNQTVTVTYNGKNYTYEINVSDPVQSIAVSGVTTDYDYGTASLDNVGSVIVTRASGSTDDPVGISNTTREGFSGTTLGDQEITVTYEGEETTYNVTVNDYVSDIEIVAPTKLTYAYNEDIDLTGATVKKIMASGTNVDAEDMTLAMISGYDKTTSGEQTITVSYAGKTKTFTVTVEEDQLVDSITVEAFEDYEIRENKTVIKALTIKNANNVEIDVKARYISITQPAKATVVLLTDDGNGTAVPVTDENAENAKYIMIKDATATGDDTFTLTVDETAATSDAVTTGEVEFTIYEAAVIDDITITNTTVDISKSSIAPVALSLTFIDQYGIEIPYSELQASDFGTSLLVASVATRIPELSSDDDEYDGQDAITIACYNENDEVVTGDVSFTYVGIVPMYDEDDEENIDILLAHEGVTIGEDEVLELKWMNSHNQEANLEITINVVD